MVNLNLIISDFVFSVSYVPLPAWNVKIFLLRSVFFDRKLGDFHFQIFAKQKEQSVNISIIRGFGIIFFISQYLDCIVIEVQIGY